MIELNEMWVCPGQLLLHEGRYYRWKPKRWVDAWRYWLARKLLHGIRTVICEDSYFDIGTSAN